jgi:hypothetical protein
MNWRDIFVSRHTLHLEKQLEDLRFTHAADIDALDKLRLEQVNDLKAAHVRELARLLEENNRLQAEINGLRLAAGQPGTVQEKEEPRTVVDPDAPPIFTGSPFERVLKREAWMNSPAGERWMKKLATMAKIGEETEKEHAAK